MKFPTSTSPTQLPTISEAGHERINARHDARREDSRLSPQPMTKIIQLPACNHCHCRVPSKGYAQAGACYQKHASRPPLPAYHERQMRTRASANGIVRGTDNSVAPMSNRGGIPVQKTRSTDIIPTLRHGSTTPGKHVMSAGKGVINTFPSSSTLASTVAEVSVKLRPRASSRACMPFPERRAMSKQATQTVRVMEWAKQRVKDAETRAREHERKLHEQTVFLLRLRRWDAEMKMRRLVENCEAEKRREEEVPRGTEPEPEPELDRSRGLRRMRKLRNLSWDKRKWCLKGLAIALDR